jgi:hypothetical protein
MGVEAGVAGTVGSEGFSGSFTPSEAQAELNKTKHKMSMDNTFLVISTP